MFTVDVKQQDNIHGEIRNILIVPLELNLIHISDFTFHDFSEVIFHKNKQVHTDSVNHKVIVTDLLLKTFVFLLAYKIKFLLVFVK